MPADDAQAIERRYERLRPAELRALAAAAPLAYMPIGPLEFHGEHLPTGVDWFEAHGLCLRAAARSGGVVLPPIVPRVRRARPALHALVPAEARARVHPRDARPARRPGVPGSGRADGPRPARPRPHDQARVRRGRGRAPRPRGLRAVLDRAERRAPDRAGDGRAEHRRPRSAHRDLVDARARAGARAPRPARRRSRGLPSRRLRTQPAVHGLARARPRADRRCRRAARRARGRTARGRAPRHLRRPSHLHLASAGPSARRSPARRRPRRRSCCTTRAPRRATSRRSPSRSTARRSAASTSSS